MGKMKKWQMVIFMAGIISLALLSYNSTVLYAHNGEGHHGEYAHTHYKGEEHMHENADNQHPYHHYHHEHDNYGDHYHNCRNIPGGRPKGAGHNILTEQECQNHGGEWEVSNN